MPAPVVGGGRSAAGGGIRVVIEPPVAFIQGQFGAFRAALLTQMPEMFEMFKPILGAMEEEQWDSGGRGSWPPLAPSTIARKGHGEIMVDSGALKASLVDPGTAMHIHGNAAEYSTGIAYAHFHQDGGSVPGRPPKRQVIPDPIPVDVRQELEKVMVTWIDSIAASTVGRI